VDAVSVMDFRASDGRVGKMRVIDATQHLEEDWCRKCVDWVEVVPIQTAAGEMNLCPWCGTLI